MLEPSGQASNRFLLHLDRRWTLYEFFHAITTCLMWHRDKQHHQCHHLHRLLPQCEINYSFFAWTADSRSTPSRHSRDTTTHLTSSNAIGIVVLIIIIIGISIVISIIILILITFSSPSPVQAEPLSFSSCDWILFTLKISFLIFLSSKFAVEACDIYIPLTTTQRYTVAHFCRLLTVLKYSPIGVKFSPTTAPHTLYTVKKKKIDKTNFYEKKVLYIYF